MSKCFEIIPLDTLFFRGAVPMEAGQYNAVSLFPPPPTVIKGAFWTHYCNKNNKPYGNTIPFNVIGMFIKKNEKIYAPAPATWFYDSNNKISTGKELNNVKLLIAESKPELQTLAAKSSAGNIVFVKPDEDAKPLTNCWVNIDFLNSKNKCFTEDSVLFPNDIYSTESRTGNALTADKQVIEGKLYTSTHIRLNPCVSIVVKFDSNLELNEGKLLLGGEKRISKFISFEEEKLEIKAEGSLFLSLIPIPATEENLSCLVSAGKISVTAGWDLYKRFHKPSESWIPAGAVFNTNINKICIPLMENRI